MSWEAKRRIREICIISRASNSRVNIESKGRFQAFSLLNHQWVSSLYATVPPFWGLTNFQTHSWKSEPWHAHSSENPEVSLWLSENSLLKVKIMIIKILPFIIIIIITDKADCFKWKKITNLLMVFYFHGLKNLLGLANGLSKGSKAQARTKPVKTAYIRKRKRTEGGPCGFELSSACDTSRCFVTLLFIFIFPFVSFCFSLQSRFRVSALSVSLLQVLPPQSSFQTEALPHGCVGRWSKPFQSTISISIRHSESVSESFLPFLSAEASSFPFLFLSNERLLFRLWYSYALP